eukprot:jgi/Mesvir1/14703/Mv05359-RA.1
MAGRYEANGLEEPLLPSVVNPPRTRRLVSIDALRGAAILVMIFDHTKDFLVKHKGEDHDPSGHPYPDHSESWSGPLQMYSDSLPYFMARFISHFCAPAFSMLMGFGMYYLKLSRERQDWTSSSILKFFLLRGAVLIVLGFFTNEALVIEYLLPHPQSATPGWSVWQVVFFLQILTSLGLQMMATGALLALADALPSVEIRGKRVTASVYVSLLAAACCLLVSAVVISSVQGPVPAIACTRPDHSRFCTQNDVTDAWGNLVRLLLIPGMVDPMKSYMAYPVLPWLPACLIGVLLAHYFKEDVKAAQGNTLYLGQAALALFVVVRIAGGHGLNFRGWPLGEGRESPLISFLNECLPAADPGLFAGPAAPALETGLRIPLLAAAAGRLWPLATRALRRALLPGGCDSGGTLLDHGGPPSGIPIVRVPHHAGHAAHPLRGLPELWSVQGPDVARLPVASIVIPAAWALKLGTTFRARMGASRAC